MGNGPELCTAKHSATHQTAEKTGFFCFLGIHHRTQHIYIHYNRFPMVQLSLSGDWTLAIKTHRKVSS